MEGVTGLSPACHPLLQVLNTQPLHPKNSAKVLLCRGCSWGFPSGQGSWPDLGSWLLVLCLLRSCWRLMSHARHARLVTNSHPMIAPGMVKPPEEQDYPALAWKQEVPLAGTFFVSLDFSSVLYHGAVALCLWPPLASSPSRPCCPGDTPMCPSTGMHSACTGRCTPQGCTEVRDGP